MVEGGREQTFHFAVSEGEVARTDEGSGGCRGVSNSRGRKQPGAAGTRQLDPDLGGDGQVEAEASGGVAALQALAADLARRPRGDGRAHLSLGQGAFQNRLELGRIAVEIARLPRTHGLPVRL